MGPILYRFSNSTRRLPNSGTLSQLFPPSFTVFKTCQTGRYQFGRAKSASFPRGWQLVGRTSYSTSGGLSQSVTSLCIKSVQAKSPAIMMELRFTRLHLKKRCKNTLGGSGSRKPAIQQWKNLIRIFYPLCWHFVGVTALCCLVPTLCVATGPQLSTVIAN